MIYQHENTVGTSVVDANAEMSYMGMFEAVEDAIAECLGMHKLDALTVRRVYNAFWVFTKNKIVVSGKLKWGDRYLVQSFVSSLSAVKMTVDTVIKNNDGQTVVYSRCEMCVLDVAEGRIRRISTLGVGKDFVVHEPLMNVEFDKIDDQDLPQVDSVTVRSTNIDYSRHCNNVEYLRFLFNTYTVEELKSLSVSEIEVCYVAQSFEGDALTVHKSVSPQKDVIAVKKNGSAVIKFCIAH